MVVWIGNVLSIYAHERSNERSNAEVKYYDEASGRNSEMTACQWHISLTLGHMTPKKKNRPKDKLLVISPTRNRQWSIDRKACISAKHSRFKEIHRQIAQKNKRRHLNKAGSSCSQG